MKDQNIPFDGLLKDLKERAKELNCLYEVIELTNKPKLTIDDVLSRVVLVIPPGWQYPQICHAKIVYDNKEAARDFDGDDELDVTLLVTESEN